MINSPTVDILAYVSQTLPHRGAQWSAHFIDHTANTANYYPLQHTWTSKELLLIMINTTEINKEIYYAMW